MNARTKPVAAEEYAVEISRVFDARPVLVFKAWSSKDHLLRWWGPRTSPQRAKSSSSARAALPPPHSWTGRQAATACRASIARSSSRRRSSSPSLGTTKPASLLSRLVTIRPEGKGSKLTFRHEPFAMPGKRATHMTSGWGEVLDKLPVPAEMAGAAVSNEEDLPRLMPLRRDQVRGRARSRRRHQEVQLQLLPEARLQEVLHRLRGASRRRRQGDDARLSKPCRRTGRRATSTTTCARIAARTLSRAAISTSWAAISGR